VTRSRLALVEHHGQGSCRSSSVGHPGFSTVYQDLWGKQAGANLLVVTSRDQDASTAAGTENNAIIKLVFQSREKLSWCVHISPKASLLGLSRVQTVAGGRDDAFLLAAKYGASCQYCCTV
jgi:hypothetical protein